MKDKVKKRVICAIILSCTALCLGGTWTWDDGGAGHAWTTCENWQATACSGLPGYPSTTNDDVNFGAGGTVVMTTVTIDDLVTEYSITFDGADGAVLTVDSLLINTSGGEVLLTVQGGATLVADGTN
jgi:hypothetical protein